MVEDKYTIQYKISGIEYNFGTGSDEPHIVLTLTDFEFGEGNKSNVSMHNPRAIWLYLNKSTFSELTDYFWDGTSKDVGRLKGNLEGKIFKLDLGMKTKK